MRNKRLTIEECNREIELAEEDVANGDVFTHEEVGEIIEQRKRR